MSDINPGLVAIVQIVTKSLTNMELASMYNCVTAGFDPTQSVWYEKAEALFTEENGTKVHQEVLRCLDSIVWRRLESESKKE